MKSLLWEGLKVNNRVLRPWRRDWLGSCSSSQRNDLCPEKKSPTWGGSCLVERCQKAIVMLTGVNPLRKLHLPVGGPGPARDNVRLKDAKESGMVIAWLTRTDIALENSAHMGGRQADNQKIRRQKKSQWIGREKPMTTTEF